MRGKTEARQVDSVTEVNITIPIGGEVVHYRKVRGISALFFARSQTPEAVEAALREAHRRLEICDFGVTSIFYHSVRQTLS